MGDDGRLLALDLEHGLGFSRMVVARAWAGQETLNTHFGPGWSDPNLIRLTQTGPDEILLWRGGQLWRVAHRQDDTFVTSNGASIRKTSEGWALKAPTREVWTFNTAGNLCNEQSSFERTKTYRYDQKERLVVIQENSDNLLTYVYDDNLGRVTRVEGAEGLRAEYQYDTQGRLVAVTNSHRVRIDYRYDSKGGLAGAQDQFENRIEPGHSKKRAEEDFRLASSVDSFGSIARRVYEPGQLEVRYPIDATGRPAGVGLNDVKVTYGYNDRGQMEQIRLPGGKSIQVAYDMAGRPTRFSFGTCINFSYDRLDRLLSIGANRPEGETLFMERYSYDLAGNLTTLVDASGRTRSLEYDADNQLVKVSGEPHPVMYEYDLGGNLWAVEREGERSRWFLDPQGRPTAGLEGTYKWDSAGNLVTSQGKASSQNTFDAAGRLLRRREEDREWRYGYLSMGTPRSRRPRRRRR
jgi:YD repeat-containing protein